MEDGEKVSRYASMAARLRLLHGEPRRCPGTFSQSNVWLDETTRLDVALDVSFDCDPLSEKLKEFCCWTQVLIFAAGRTSAGETALVRIRVKASRASMELIPRLPARLFLRLTPSR